MDLECQIGNKDDILQNLFRFLGTKNELLFFIVMKDF